MSNVFGGGDSGYSPIHTPSPMHGNPLTPGGPMSPAYTPQTPMGQFDDGMMRFILCWLTWLSIIGLATYDTKSFHIYMQKTSERQLWDIHNIQKTLEKKTI